LCNIWNKVETYILWTSVSIDCTSQLKETQELHAFLGWMPRFYTSAQDSIHHNPLILQIYTNVLLPIWTVCIKQDFPLLSLLLTSVPFSPFTKCNRCRYNTVYPTTFCWCNTIQQEQIAGTFLIGYYQTMANKNRSKNQFHQHIVHFTSKGCTVWTALIKCCYKLFVNDTNWFKSFTKQINEHQTP